MTGEQFILTIEALLCLALVVWFFSGPWQTLWIAFARQHFFELRDQLFNMAAADPTLFANPAYLQLREYLNGCIRFAHKMTFLKFLAGTRGPASRLQKKHDLPAMIEGVANEEVRREMRDILRKSVLILLRHMIIRSPFALTLLLFTPLIIISLQLIEGVEWMFMKLRDQMLAQTETGHLVKPRHYQSIH